MEWLWELWFLLECVDVWVCGEFWLWRGKFVHFGGWLRRALCRIQWCGCCLMSANAWCQSMRRLWKYWGYAETVALFACAYLQHGALVIGKKIHAYVVHWWLERNGFDCIKEAKIIFAGTSVRRVWWVVMVSVAKRRMRELSAQKNLLNWNPTTLTTPISLQMPLLLGPCSTDGCSGLCLQAVSRTAWLILRS